MIRNPLIASAATPIRTCAACSWARPSASRCATRRGCWAPGRALSSRNSTGPAAGPLPFRSRVFEHVTRYFTLQQAERLLPDVDRAIREAIGLKADYQQAETELRSAMQRVMMLGGVDLNRGAFLELRTRREARAERLKAGIDQSHDV